MPRRSCSSDIERGILTVGTAARLLCLSTGTVKKLCSDGLIQAANISTTKGREEWRISSPTLELYCIDNTLPVHRDLKIAVKNFEESFV